MIYLPIIQDHRVHSKALAIYARVCKSHAMYLDAYCKAKSILSNYRVLVKELKKCAS